MVHPVMRLLSRLLPCAFAAALSAAEAPAPASWPGLVFHKAPAPRAAGAVDTDWPRFLGPLDTPVSPETKLRADLPPEGLPIVWECPRGESYACPAIVGDHLVHFHNLSGRETIDCLDTTTGRRRWSHAYPIDYHDDFGYGSGPRAGPVIADGKVVTFGVTSRLRCLDLATGRVLWEHDCQEKFKVPKYFFGSGASPLVRDGRVIVNLGGDEERCVCAFDLATGALRWTTKHEWGQSYASPIAATLHGRPRVLVFAGGKSDPATGGLLSIDPADGKADTPFFWRARRYPSVNAATPVLCGPDKIFISQAYVDRDSPCNGGVLLEARPDGSFAPLWKSPDFGCHWTTPVHHDGHLYGFSGEKDRQCRLVCHDAATGALKWSEQFSWPVKGTDGQEIPVGLFRGSLLRVDGRFLCLGEWGTLCWLDLTPAGAKVLAHCQLFTATQSWTLPALSRGLLFVCQNEPDRLTGKPARLLCFDLRARE